MTLQRAPLDVFELEDDLPGGWYLHRFGVGKRMVICLDTINYIGQNICNSSLISPKHASVEQQQDGSWLLKDLNSQNGTYVNDKIVPKDGLVLEEWDVICFGRKRPRNANEFGFMLKFKVNSEFETNTSDDATSSSLSSVSTVNNTDFDKSSDSENRKRVLSVDEKLQPISKDGTDILISEHSCEGDDSDNISEETVKFSSVDKVDQIALLQEEMVSVKEKITNWLMTKDKSSAMKRRLRQRTNNYVESNYETSDDNFSDSGCSSRLKRKRYETRPKIKDSFDRDKNFSPSGSEVSEDSESNGLNISQTEIKRLKLISNYNDDCTWKPRRTRKPQKLKSL